MKKKLAKYCVVLSCVLEVFSTSGWSAPKKSKKSTPTAEAPASVPAPVASPVAESVPTANIAMTDPLNEVEGSSTTALSFQSGADTSFSLRLGYSRTVREFLQLTGSSALVTQGNVTRFNFLIGPTYNHKLDSGGLRSAAYARVLGGLAYASDGVIGAGTLGPSTAIAYAVEAGKRFELFSAFTWKPAIMMTGVFASSATPRFTVLPIQFSFLF